MYELKLGNADGKKIKNYDNKFLKIARYIITKAVNTSKYLDNLELYQLLLSTGKIIDEATSCDMI